MGGRRAAPDVTDRSALVTVKDEPWVTRDAERCRDSREAAAPPRTSRCATAAHRSRCRRRTRRFRWPRSPRMDDLIFFGWQRAGGALTAEAHAGRLRAEVTLEARAVETGARAERPTSRSSSTDRATSSISCRVRSPACRLPPARKARKRRCARSSSWARPIVPWRYTPAPQMRPMPTRGGRGSCSSSGPTSEVALQPGGRVAIVARCCRSIRSAIGALGARTADEPAAPAKPHVVSRLLSPFDMAPNTDYLAVVVPAFDAAMALRCGTARPMSSLPAYHSWRFRTGDAGDFKDLALRLHARNIDDPLVARVGGGDLEYPLPGTANVVTVRSALVPPSVVPPSGVDPDGPAPPDVAAANAAMRLPAFDPQGRHVVQLPLYGDAWVRRSAAHRAGGWGAHAEWRAATSRCRGAGPLVRRCQAGPNRRCGA